MQIYQIDERRASCILSEEEKRIYKIKDEFNENYDLHRKLLADISKELGWEEKINDYFCSIIVYSSAFGNMKIEIELLTQDEIDQKELECTDMRYGGEVYLGDYLSDEEDYEDEDFEYEDDEYEDEYEDDDKYGNEDTSLENLLNELNMGKPLLPTPCEQNKDKKIKKIYCFDTLNNVIEASRLIKKFFLGESSLYKDEFEKQFYLFLNYDIANKVDEILIDGRLQEYCKFIDEKMKESNLKEHMNCIINVDAINRLSKF